jgi:3-oxoacyl-[acyl-carrier protein] reductase
MGPLAGRVAIVTGASRGIGAAVARALATDGAMVVAAARSREALEQLAAGIRASGGEALAHQYDAADASTIDALVDRTLADVGRIDIVVNNAGFITPAQRTEQMRREDWQRTLDVNLTAPWLLSCRAKAAMTRNPGGGVIVNISSNAGSAPIRGLTGYCVAKAGLDMLTAALALEFGRDGIRVVGVAPGKIDTDMLAPFAAHLAKTGVPVNLLGHLGEAADIAHLVSFLVSDRASYLTGMVVTADGGDRLLGVAR